MNCIIAQSGGPTSVINASVYGVVKENFNLKVYDNVFGGINGIEGILHRDIVNLSSMTLEELERFKNSPSSGLGSCRYKLKDFHDDKSEYIKLIEILNELNVKTFFYVGGNDSMDTTYKLSEYAKMHSIDIKFIGIPKTIDNDLMHTDHTPGFGSASKFITTTVMETFLDSNVYRNNGIFIVETMGRDTGWLTASASLAEINGIPCADLIYIPEKPFYVDKFLNDVRKVYEKKKYVYIVACEGLRNPDGTFVAENSCGPSHDNFGHAQLGGVANYLKALIMNASISSRVKSLELGILQRCSMHCSSKIDMDEATMVGKDALKYSLTCESGNMVAIKRDSSVPYKSSSFLVEAKEVANNIKYFPIEWLNDEGNGISDAGKRYLKPLISDYTENCSLPSYTKFSGHSNNIQG